MTARPITARLRGVCLLRSGALEHSPAQVEAKLAQVGVSRVEARLAFASAWKRVTRITGGQR